VKSYVPGQRARRWLIAAILLACSGWVTASSAQAGCSHSVTMKTDAARFMIAGLERLVSGGALSEGSGQTFPRSEPSTPCSGFFCAGNSMPPLPLAAPEALPRVDAWNRFDLCALAPRASSSPFPFDDGPAHSMDRAERLSRPPRSSASRESF
jgi:hypothetical protein